MKITHGIGLYAGAETAEFGTPTDWTLEYNPALPDELMINIEQGECVVVTRDEVKDLARILQNWLDRGTFEDKPQIVHGVNCPETYKPAARSLWAPNDGATYLFNGTVYCMRCHQPIGIHGHSDDPGHPGTEGPPGIETPVGANYPTPDSGRYVPPHFREDHYAD